jgi:hypothetical protein
MERQPARVENFEGGVIIKKEGIYWALPQSVCIFSTVLVIFDLWN